MMASRKRSNKPHPARLSPTPRGVDREKPNAPSQGVATPSVPVPVEFDGVQYAQRLIRSIPDFPEPGILFRDITPLLADPKGFHIVLDVIAHRFVGESIQAVVGIESRGFIFGGALAARLNTASPDPLRVWT
jgi:adenine phosphoribosyltransferase